MTDVTPEMFNWQGRCESSSCLEIAKHNGLVYLRSTDDPDTVVVITDAEWLYFITNVA